MIPPTWRLNLEFQTLCNPHLLPLQSISLKLFLVHIDSAWTLSKQTSNDYAVLGLLGFVYTGTSVAKTFVTQRWERTPFWMTKVLVAKSASVDSTLLAEATHPVTKLPPLVGGVFILSLRELSTGDKEWPHSHIWVKNTGFLLKSFRCSTPYSCYKQALWNSRNRKLSDMQIQTWIQLLFQNTTKTWLLNSK